MMQLRGFEWLLRRGFTSFSRILCRYPLVIIFIALFVAAGLGTGILNIEFEDDTEYLFAPQNSRARMDRMILDQLFPVDDLNSLPNRFIYLSQRRVSIIITAKDAGNILRREHAESILQLDENIRQARLYYEENSTVVNFSDLCSQWNGNCFENPAILSLQYHLNESSPVIHLPFPSVTSPDGVSYIIEPFFGGRHVDKNGLVSADAVLLNYHLQSSPLQFGNVSGEWERFIIDLIESTESPLIDIYGYNSESLDDAQSNVASGAIPYLMGSFAILVVFSSLSCVTVRDGVQSKPWIGILGVINVILAVVSSVGLLAYCGLDFNQVVISMPFIILGIGLDDMFIMVSAWRATSSSLSTNDRIAKTLEDAGVSIAITSITDFLAFCVGSFSPLPVIRTFCVYTAVAVVFDFLYQITFFGAFMVLFGHMESFNCHGVTCLPLPASTHREVDVDATANGFYDQGNQGVENGANFNHNHKRVKEHAVMEFFRDYYAKLISKPASLMLVTTLYICYVIGSGYFVTRLEIGVEHRMVTEEGSMTAKYLQLFSTYFEETGPSVSVVFTEPYPYWYRDKQEAIETVMKEFHDNRHIKNRKKTEFWLDGYVNYLQTIYGTSEIAQNTFITILKEEFLNLPCCKKFRLDINFNGDEISSSRFIALTRDVTSAEHERLLLEDVRDSVDKATVSLGIPVIASSVGFVFSERYGVIVTSTLFTLGVTVLSMLLIFLVIIPVISVALLATLSVASILLGVVGFMACWNVALGSISMVNLVLCIGFSIDFSAHIAYSLVMQNTDEQDISIAERLSRALYRMGYPILQSGLSTICAVLVLIWSKSQILVIFAKIITLVMIFGMLHGLLFVPTAVIILTHISRTCQLR